ncbi:hypothetical protein BD779DRAFT_709439 [Infundibulicybe gibba]|nr:hypothetical protein BD779DRAFT_709439 [Infundibulicybe gibba]
MVHSGQMGRGVGLRVQIFCYVVRLCLLFYSKDASVLSQIDIRNHHGIFWGPTVAGTVVAAARQRVCVLHYPNTAVTSVPVSKTPGSCRSGMSTYFHLLQKSTSVSRTRVLPDLSYGSQNHRTPSMLIRLNRPLYIMCGYCESEVEVPLTGPSMVNGPIEQLWNMARVIDSS